MKHDHTPSALRDLRVDYSRDTLQEEHAGRDPFALLRGWLAEATASEAPDANAMTLATVGAEGQPTARVVLIKELDARGIVWFTNYQSRKGQELAVNPKACALFFWPGMQRQVRVEGLVERVSAAESDDYWRVRPLASRWGAVASPQSQVIPNRAWLEARMEQLRTQHPTQADDPPRPAHWGGYRLLPSYWEFWQGRRSRLHDRLVFRPASGTSSAPTENWRMERLAP